jgi:hypothetical protein
MANNSEALEERLRGGVRIPSEIVDKARGKKMPIQQRATTTTTHNSVDDHNNEMVGGMRLRREDLITVQ